VAVALMPNQCWLSVNHQVFSSICV